MTNVHNDDASVHPLWPALRGLLTTRQAACALRVSEEAVLAFLCSGALNIVRGATRSGIPFWGVEALRAQLERSARHEARRAHADAEGRLPGPGLNR